MLRFVGTSRYHIAMMKNVTGTLRKWMFILLGLGVVAVLLGTQQMFELVALAVALLVGSKVVSGVLRR